ncbi:hypothetical protein M6D93_04435 [Jatrophihabitans telluris]|uniref:PH domain-containing protein n=1 Tax=Jatrophihabitans telluris TaxID=2038343 RepID=A0ABY4R091_9ACTN|nr:hypothetical protein [Jatrophihabitans telluris]UQX89254.1 hypothetical protein M6D93_04435 [Jatrophihabitans telluris]
MVGRCKRYLTVGAALLGLLLYGLFLAACAGAFGPPPPNSLEAFAGGCVASLFSWPSVVALFIRVDVRGPSLRVMNILGEYYVAAADIAGFDTRLGLRIITVGQRRIRVSAAQQSLAGTLSGNKHVKAVAAHIETWRAAQVGDAPPAAATDHREIHIKPRFALLGVLISWTLFFAVSDVLAYRLSR